MTKAELYEFVTSLCDNIAIDYTLFDNFLDVAQMNLEGLRPWIILRAEDMTQGASPQDTFSTGKILPADFQEWAEESSVNLIGADNNYIGLTEIPYSQRFRYKSSSGRFCVDYANSLFYLLGTITQGYTIQMNYIKASTLVSTSDATSWVFPARFHKILGFLVAIYWRKGIDYDVFNQIKADNQNQQVGAILDIMTRWDSNLQYNMQRGKDPFDSNTIGSGSINGGYVQS